MRNQSKKKILVSLLQEGQDVFFLAVKRPTVGM